MPRWSSGRKWDCQTKGLGFDTRVGKNITGLFSVFRKLLNSGTETGIVPSIRWSLLNMLYMIFLLKSIDCTVGAVIGQLAAAQHVAGSILAATLCVIQKLLFRT
ncbi:hypothetical protein SFRURICE_010414 [Spodoptera frugiperda]|nr:hypothetical protein SFRURICE_010414 [Spodoptera frugiperda]